MGKDPSLAPGFRFHPTDVELVWYYLKRKISGRSIPLDAISEIDIYKSEPWDLPEKSKLKSRDLEWYFFSLLDRKYRNGSKTNRATERGYWKTTGKDRSIGHASRVVAMKKTLVFHLGRAPRGERTNWVMHEYRLVDESVQNAGVSQSAFVLCRVFQKSGTGSKNGEQYGAPFIEDEWDDDDRIVIVPGNDPVDFVVLPSDHVGSNELDQVDEDLPDGTQLSIPSNTLHFIGETSGLKQEEADYPDPDLDPNPINNHHLENQTFFIDSSQNGCCSSKNTTHLDTPYLDEAGISLDRLADPSNYLGDLASDHLNYVYDPSTDAIDEYATCFDTDDILQYLSFDSTDMAGFGSQEKAKDIEAGCNDVDTKSDEHYQSTLGFPENDTLLSLKANSAAAESSGSVRVTAGLVETLDSRMREKWMVWSFEKTGGSNVILSFTVLPYESCNGGKRSAGLPLCWVYCLLFWVLSLSLSCKCLYKVTCD